MRALAACAILLAIGVGPVVAGEPPTPEEATALRRMWPGWDSRPQADKDRKLEMYRQWMDEGRGETPPGESPPGAPPGRAPGESSPQIPICGRAPAGRPCIPPEDVQDPPKERDREALCRLNPDACKQPPEPEKPEPLPPPEEPPVPPGVEPGQFAAQWRGLTPEQQRLAMQIIEAIRRGDMAALERLLLGKSPETLMGLLSRLGASLAGPDGKPLNLSDKFWNELARRNPDSPAPQSALGNKKLKEGKNEEAKDAYGKAIEKGGATPDNFVGRGVAKDGLGDVRGANADARAALALDPSHKGAQSLFQLTEGRIPKLALDPKAGRVSSPDFDAGVAAGAPASARSQLPLPRGADPLQLSSRLTGDAGRALQAGNLQGAIGYATQALGQFPRNAQALNLRAMARERSGDRNGAVEDATEALKISPRNASILNTRAWALNGLGRHEEALQDAEQAAAAEPDNAFAFLNIARAQGGLGKRAEMLAALKKAAGLDPRFEKTLEEALQKPERADTELLFGGLRSARPQAGESRTKRFLIMLGFALVGGLLIAGALVSLMSPQLKKSVTEAWRKSVGAALGQGAPTGKFWEYYSYKRELGSGGMGVVYEAVDESLGRRVAVKQMRGEIRDDKDEREWFIKEARLVAALHHPNIVEIYSIIEDESELYLVFEYVEGKTLEELLAERGRFPVEEAARIIKGVCAAIQHAHDKGIIHRDLKPSNIIVDAQGDAKVMDFGIARHAPSDDRTMKLTSNILGTPPYMAPEAEDGGAGKASDVFSIGVCLYELLTGEPPFKGSATAMHTAKLYGNFIAPSRFLATIPKSLDTVVANALTPVTASRYQQPAQLYAELERLMQKV